MERSDPVHVVTSCRGRFHIFDQARELARHDALLQLITDYPKSWPSRFGVPRDKVHSMMLSGLINHGWGRIRGYSQVKHRNKVDRWIHDRFSRKLAKLIPEDAHYFIGLSSFCLEALKVCRELGIPSAVDHGSLHQLEERQLLAEEADRFGLSFQEDSIPDWIVAKENEEFSEAETIFAISGLAKKSLVRCGVPEEKIFVNQVGVDLTSFRPGKKKDDVFRIIQVGSVCLGKGVLTLLDAFAKLKRPGAVLWIVGDGQKNSGFRSIVDKLTTPGVAFKSPVPQANLREFYNQSSVFVLASVADGFAMVVLQAMACELPVIITENVGASELIEDGVNGFVVPVGAPEIISERLCFLHDNPEHSRAMGLAAAISIENGYTWNDYGNRLTSFVAERQDRIRRC